MTVNAFDLLRRRSEASLDDCTAAWIGRCPSAANPGMLRPEVATPRAEMP
jgi:hypothetical protein